PPASGAAQRARGPDDAAGEAARRWSEGVADLPTFRQLLDPDRFDGSNEWGVAGSLTSTGRPTIANDPHLALDLPSTFYPIGLQSPGMRVVGSGFAGVPSVILGHNEHITWGATTNPLDVTDAYREQVVDDPASPSGLSTVYEGRREPVVEIPEEFRVNQPDNGTADDTALVPPGTPVEGSDLGPVPESTLIVPRRNNGPLVLRAFSLQYTGFSGTRELDTFLRWNKAEGLDDFRDGLQYFDAGSQNWAYADRDGNLGYFTSAEMPLREDLEAGAVDGLPPWFLRDGTGGNEWLPDDDPAPGQAIPYQILPPEEMPQVLNPPAGFFVNANNDPAGTTLDNDPLNGRRPTGGIYYLNPGYDGFRAGRITDRIEEEIGRDGSLSFADMAAIQADTELIDAQFFVPHLLDAFERAAGSATPALAALGADAGVAEAIGRLAAWDFSTPTGVAEGYDAADVDGGLSSPSPREISSSVAATIYSVWRGQVLGDTVDATLEALGLPTPGGAEALTALRTLLERFGERGGTGASGLDFFAGGAGAGVEPADRRDLVLLGSLAGALELLAGDEFAAAFGRSTDQDDYRWGRLHRIVFEHLLGEGRDAPPVGGFALPAGLEGIATDGGFGTVDASGHSARADADDEFMFGSGPVRRYVGEAGSDVIRAESSLPGGASGDVASPHYVDRLGEWLTNDTFRQELSPGRFRRQAVEVLELRP
ncbi:MAG: penicillin acylase family protein, partial [Actinomycetota bacterium]|nr:penicillin acylase family protein [Actinomycetota bacterium]